MLVAARDFATDSVEGQRYIDFCQSFGPNILGHRDPEIEKVLEQSIHRAWSFGACEPYSLELAEWVVERLPWVEKIRFVSSGTEAVMSALRVARAVTKRSLILKFEGCYHGHADSLLVKAGSGALTHGQPDSAGVPKSFAELTVTLPFNNVVALRSLFMARGSQIAAVIVEPVPANAGLYLPNEGFLEVLRQQCSQYGAVLIFDEVMTGFRVAFGGAQVVVQPANVRKLLLGRGAPERPPDQAHLSVNFRVVVQ